MNLHKVLRVISVLAFLLTTTVSVALAGDGTGDCVQAVKGAVDAALDSPSDTESNHGDAISDGFFGNEPNLTDTNTNLDLGPNEVDPGSSAGSVVPSQSPGPKVNNGGFTTWGSVYRGLTRDLCAH